MPIIRNEVMASQLCYDIFEACNVASMINHFKYKMPGKILTFFIERSIIFSIVTKIGNMYILLVNWSFFLKVIVKHI